MSACNSEVTLKSCRFGEFEFDFASGQLWRRQSRVKLRPKAAVLLGILLRARGQVVDRTELKEAIWGNRVVEWEMGLHRLVHEVRAIIEVDPAKPELLETIPRKGYRIELPPPAEPTRPPPGLRLRAKWFVAGLVTPAAVVFVICASIAVRGLVE